MATTARAGTAGASSRALWAALALTLVVVAAGVALRLLDIFAGQFPFGTTWFPALFAVGGLIAAALLLRRAPALAWFAMAAASAIGAIEVVGVIRDRQATTTLRDWPIEVAVAVTALVLAAGVAGAYASRSPTGNRQTTRGRLWRLLVVVGFGVVVVAGVLAIGTAASLVAFGFVTDAGGLRVDGRIAAGFIAIATLGGMWLDLGGPIGRARARGGGLPAFPRALADELLPTSTAMRRQGVEHERARLAAELHARVLPDLRRAAEAAEATGAASDPLAVGLRHAVEDVEELMHGRQSVVLEEYGLVAALEWLAERTQQRRPLVVDLELDGASVDDPGAVTKPIAQAAFRIAQLAVDNVVRHAGATRVVLHLTVDAARFELVIEDDGTGIEPGRERGSRAGRGLHDMRAAAAEIGATLRVERREPGTLIDLVHERGSAAPGGAQGADPGAATPR
jgi:signal transduction histidine kinase